MKMMKAVVYTALGRANGSVTEIPYPVCGDDDIIIKVVSSGICRAADSMIDTTGSPLDIFPNIPGHEFAGYVQEIGKNVTQFKIGDRVTADNTVPCGDCYYCRRNLPSLCQNFGSLGHNIHGGMAQYVRVHKNKVFHIADNLSFNAACITEPVACAMQAIDKMRVQFGDKVLVFGAGPHGMILSMLLKGYGAEVVCLAPSQWKLDMLNKKGIKTIQMSRNDHSIHEKRVREMFPCGVDKAVDTTGNNAVLGSATHLLRNGGEMYLYSSPHKPKDKEYYACIDADEMYFRELSLIPTGLQTHKYGRCLEAMASGIVDTEMLVTNEYPIEKYFEALDMNVQHGSEVLKIVIHPND